MRSTKPHRFRPVPTRKRRPAPLRIEPLESRRLLSTAATETTVTPSVTAITADWGRWNPPPPPTYTGITNPTPPSSAYTPAQIAKAYSLSQTSSSGAGTTIAIVDAYNDPNIKSDLAAFDAQYGLPAANLTVVNQYGSTNYLPQTSADWSLEIALDVEWAHAAAPGAKILLVEANSASTSDLMTAVQTAANTPNVVVVSMSWGGSEFANEAAYDSAAYFGKSNVTFVAATGDDGGQSGAEWPSVSPDVVGVGGTSLTASSNGTYLGESSWSASYSWRSGASGSAGGVSAYESQPNYQASALGSTYSKRATPDVSAVGNPSTGLAVYDSVYTSGQSGWFKIGGTSAGAPIWSGLIAAADSARLANGLAPLSSTQTLALLYSLYGSTKATASSYASAFHDITGGSNYAGSASTGYDLVTGLGTPVANKIIAAASTYGANSSSVVRAKAVAASTTTGTTTTPHVLTADATAVVATTATPATIVVIINPAIAVFTPVPTGLGGSATTNPATAILTRTNIPLPVAQPLARATPEFTPKSLSDEAPRDLPDHPAPGIFFAPTTPAEPGDVGPMPAAPGTRFGRPWEQSVQFFLDETDLAPATGFVPAALPAVEPDDRATSGLSRALASAAAIAVWGVWELQARRVDGNRKRGMVPWESLPSQQPE